MAEPLDRAIDTFRTADGLVMDLRGNPGGLLDQAVQVSERFLPAGKLDSIQVVFAPPSRERHRPTTR